MLDILILLLGLFSGQADYDRGTWSVNDHVVGYAETEHSPIITTDFYVVDLGGES